MISALKFAVMFGISVVFGGAVYVAVSFFGGVFLVGFAVASIVWGAVWYVSLRSKNTEDKMLILMGILRDIRKTPQQLVQNLLTTKQNFISAKKIKMRIPAMMICQTLKK